MPDDEPVIEPFFANDYGALEPLPEPIRPEDDSFPLGQTYNGSGYGFVAANRVVDVIFLGVEFGAVVTVERLKTISALRIISPNAGGMHHVLIHGGQGERTTPWSYRSKDVCLSDARELLYRTYKLLESRNVVKGVSAADLNYLTSGKEGHHDSG